MDEKQLKYKELLQQSKEEKGAEEIEFQVDEAKQTLQSDVLETKRALSAANKKLRSALGAVPFNSQAIVTAQIEIESYEDGLKRLESLLANHF